MAARKSPRSPEYLPLIPGLVLEYRGAYDAGREAGSYRKLEILKAEKKGRSAVARCRWTYEGVDGKGSREAVVTAKDGWATNDGGFLELPVKKLFPVPPAVGADWTEGRWEHRISGLDTEVYIGDDAGVPMVIKNCLRVAWQFSEGSGENVYAPGIGLVKSTSTDEQFPYGFILTSAAFPKRLKKKNPSRRRR